MEKILLSKAWEIMDLSKAQGVDLGVARDMFVANLNNYGVPGAEFYDGADVDYAVLSKAWKAMPRGQQAQAKRLCREAMQQCYSDLCAARKAKDKGAFYRALLNFEAPVPPKPPEFLLYKHAWEIWETAKERRVTLQEAKDAYLKTLPEWAALTDKQREKEEQWFARRVDAQERSLRFAYDTGDRFLFEALLVD